MIACHLLCHGNFEQVALQIGALYYPDDVFLIDIDDGQNPDLAPLDRFAPMPNVYLV